MERIELRKSLFELRHSIDLAKNIWINNDSTNCYAYALGLDIPEDDITKFAYEPGVISGGKDIVGRKFTYEEFMRRMIADFNALGIDYGSIQPGDPIKDGEWKVALFLRYSRVGFDNFHFLRQKEDGVWYHKLGYNGEVSMVDSFGHLITDPTECEIFSGEYDSCFRLKLK